MIDLYISSGIIELMVFISIRSCLYMLIIWRLYMDEIFTSGTFNDLNLSDHFFDSLKNDYPGFDAWFLRKTNDNTPVFYCKSSNNKILAMLYLKNETEEIQLNTQYLGPKKRKKIGTLKLDESLRNTRLGEGAIGIALWSWMNEGLDEIYVTIYEKHKKLVSLFEKFGFLIKGKNSNGELVMLKDKNNLSYDTPYKSFPYINPNSKKFGMIPIVDFYHDTLFPYSKLQRNFMEDLRLSASNGITKTFLGFPRGNTKLEEGECVFIYRIHSGENKYYNSVISSYCTISKIEMFYPKEQSFYEFKKLVKNRTVFTDEKLLDFYKTRYRIMIIDLVYNGYFGSGNNVNYDYLNKNGLFEVYPYNIEYTYDDAKKIFQRGRVNVPNLIID
jgi:hypothetical protein